MIRTLFLTLVSTSVAFASPPRPNVILIVTDDQGYGEIAAHGNPVIKTPHLDKLHGESLRLTDFHVDPTCSPTRAAMITGRYSTRTGVWHTINGRSMMAPDEITLAEVFKANGYETAMIGKWHLGDNYPCRPQDQGFDHVVRHFGGGLDNAPEFWGNDYFDDTFEANGVMKKFDGYCTDVWFQEATRYVEAPREKPFFLYLATNAPHGPYLVPETYAAPYLAAGLPPTLAKFYGMITNIDENLGRFRARLAELGLAENTLLIYMTDNGTSAGFIDTDAKYPYFNAGMRGWKSSAWDGGHRVPSFWHWPKRASMSEGEDFDGLTAHIDVLPTLVDLLDLKQPDGPPVDGVSYRNLTRDRTLFVHVQRDYLPPKWKNSPVMNQHWRLIDGRQLYDIKADPGQQTDIADAHPDVVVKLRAEYESWWASLKPAMERTVRYGLGGAENPMVLTSHDWLMEPGERDAAWHQIHVSRGDIANGPWAVDVAQAGRYEIKLHRWPPYLEKPMGMVEARLRIGDQLLTRAIKEDATAATFEIDLPAGPAMLKTWLKRPGPERLEHGAYYVEVRRLESPRDTSP